MVRSTKKGDVVRWERPVSCSRRTKSGRSHRYIATGVGGDGSWVGRKQIALEAQGDDVVHQDRLAEEISGGELCLLDGQCGGIDEDSVA